MTRGVGVIEETPWWLEVNGQRVAAGTVRPGRIREMAAGRLLADGWIRGVADILALDTDADGGPPIAIEARVAAECFAAAATERAHRLETGCGLLHFVRCDPASVRRPRYLEIPALDAFPALFRTLFDTADRASAVGGIHVAALTDGATLMTPCDDVSRHNAVDKAIGAAVLAGHETGRLGLVVTSRVSGEMALKAARAGIAWVASRSVATTLAVAIAEAGGLPLVARAPRPDAEILADPATREMPR